MTMTNDYLHINQTEIFWLKRPKLRGGGGEGEVHPKVLIAINDIITWSDEV